MNSIINASSSRLILYRHAHEKKKITGLLPIYILTLSLLNLTSVKSAFREYVVYQEVSNTVLSSHHCTTECCNSCSCAAGSQLRAASIHRPVGRGVRTPLLSTSLAAIENHHHPNKCGSSYASSLTSAEHAQAVYATVMKGRMYLHP